MLASSRRSSQENPEVTLELPMELMENTVGFVVDAGSSLTKVAYRPRDIFSYGKPIKEEEKGQLRLRCFDLGDERNLVKFLKKNCDVIYSGSKPIKAWMTGIRMSRMKGKLEKHLNVDVRMLSEVRSLEQYLFNMKRLSPKCMRPTDGLLTACREALAVVVSEAAWERKQKMFSGETDQRDRSAFQLTKGPAYDLLYNENPKEWIEANMTPPSHPAGPALVVSIGSNLVVSLIDDKGRMDLVDFLDNGGKTMLGLSKQLISIDSFNKLVDKASRGDASKVHVSMDEARSVVPDGEDYYSNASGNMTVFSLGKLAQTSKSSFRKRDIAAALVDNMASTITKVAFLNARLFHMNTVYVCGSVSSHLFTRAAIEGRFMAQSVTANIRGMPFIKIFFFDNPGFLTVLGTWLFNYEKAVAMREAKEKLAKEEQQSLD